MAATPPVARQKQEIGLPVVDFTLPLISGEAHCSRGDCLLGKPAAGVLFGCGAIDNFKYPMDSGYQAYLEPAITSFLASEPIARKETASFGCAIQSVYYILPKPL